MKDEYESDGKCEKCVSRHTGHMHNYGGVIQCLYVRMQCLLVMM